MNKVFDITSPCSCGYVFEYMLVDGFSDYKIEQPCLKCGKRISINFGRHEDIEKHNETIQVSRAEIMHLRDCSDSDMCDGDLARELCCKWLGAE